MIEIQKTTFIQVKDTINGGLNADTQREVFEALGRLSDAKTFFETHREIKSASSVLSTIEIYLSVRRKCLIFSQRSTF